jgi:hypothetical protein
MGGTTREWMRMAGPAFSVVVPPHPRRVGEWTRWVREGGSSLLPPLASGGAAFLFQGWLGGAWKPLRRAAAVGGRHVPSALIGLTGSSTGAL